MSALLNYPGSIYNVSPVSSITFIVVINFFLQEWHFSWHKLLIGARYRHLVFFSFMSLAISSSNSTVFPEDVGADTIILSE